MRGLFSVFSRRDAVRVVVHAADVRRDNGHERLHEMGHRDDVPVGRVLSECLFCLQQ